MKLKHCLTALLVLAPATVVAQSQVEGSIGGKLGVSDSPFTDAVNTGEYDIQDILLSLSYQNIYMDAAILKREGDSSSNDADGGEFSVGYSYALPDQVNVFGGLGYRTLDLDGVDTQSSGLTLHAGADVRLHSAFSIKGGFEVFDGEFESNSTVVSDETETAAFVEATYYTGNDFSLSLEYRQLFKQTALSVRYHF